MATADASGQKATLGKYVAALTVLVVLTGFTVLHIVGYRLQAQVLSPDASGYHIGPTEAFYDSMGGGYQDESGYGLQVGRLGFTCMKVIASRAPH